MDPTPSRDAFRFALADEQDFVEVDADHLLQIAAAVLRDEQITQAEVSLALVDDASIHEINRRYLNHDFPTDVISFSLQDDDGPPRAETHRGRRGRLLEGEIVISGETASRVAQEWGAAPEAEVALYLVHGLLHLCGYDDHSAADRSEMRQRERTHLQKFGIRPNY
ncbi:MAG: rRNA maturation RNase YbeY [Planctomycetaceae bacterium]